MTRPRGSFFEEAAGPLPIFGRPVETMSSAAQRWMAIGLLLTGLSFLGAWTWEQLDARLFQRSAAMQLEALQARAASTIPGRTRSPGKKASARAPLIGGEPIGRIEIDRVGLSAIVAEGTDTRTLRRAVGHVHSTPLPGDDGNVVLAGHRDTFFRPLRSVEEGDRIQVTMPEGRVEYEVTSIEVVGAGDIDVMWPTKERSLTLITCYPFRYIGPAPDRYVVRARQVD